MKAKTKQFVICVSNDGYKASLEVRKIYAAIPDAEAEAHDCLRIVDESGEDYLYPAGYFVAIDLPHAAKLALVAA